jgi:adenylosuccinate synthase
LLIENLPIKRVILISGHISSGKSTLAIGLAKRCDMEVFKTNEILKAHIGPQLANNRKALQQEGERLDIKTRGQWVTHELMIWLRRATRKPMIIVDSVRTVEQIEGIRKVFGPIVTHIHLTAPSPELAKRYKERHKQGLEATDDFGQAQADKTEEAVESLRDTADVVIDTNRCTIEDLLVRAACHLKVYGGKSNGYVDVLIGGQYGSEGKGQVSAYLAKEYDLLVRVGGPNAGHMIYEEPKPYAHHQLPSGTRRCEARLLIGPGAVLNVEKLLREIAECEVNADRLTIDEQAMIISKQDIKKEATLKEKVSSTGQGVGWATARRIQDRGNATTLLARDIPELKPFLGGAIETLHEILSRGGRVFLEGTQGTGLSLYHGVYPYVTSRDTTVAGCLAETGIPPSHVRKVVMVCRTYPIRVANPPGGTSGPMSQETNWKEISRRSDISYDELRRTEKTTTTYRDRRVSEFDWGLLRKAVLLNAPTDIALTFVDYLDKVNRNARRFEQLTPVTIKFIQEIEHVSGAPVSLISTRFSYRSIIDRRSW